MKHQHLRTIDFLSVVPRVVKGAAVEFGPILVGETIGMAESLADVGSVVLLRSLRFLRAPQDRPVHHRAVGNASPDAWIEGEQNRCRPAEASSDDEDLVRREAEATTESDLFKLRRKLVKDVEDVFVRRFSKKLTATLPGPAISGVNHPKTPGRQKLCQ